MRNSYNSTHVLPRENNRCGEGQEMTTLVVAKGGALGGDGGAVQARLSLA